jgi:hypothetical protein
MTDQDDIVSLRHHLFRTIEALRNEDNPMDLDRAKTIATVAQTVINSATAEVKWCEATGAEGSGFVPTSPQRPALEGDKPTAAFPNTATWPRIAGGE